MKGKNILVSFLTAIAGGIISLVIFTHYYKDDQIASESNQKPQVQLTKVVPVDSNVINFSDAAEKTVDAVVHVKTSYANAGYSYGNPLLDFFFGRPNYSEPEPVMGSGSGVIITNDGFIVTNNHVIQDAKKIEVVLNDKRTFEAKLVGRDPSTDIALLKIGATDLPFIPFGNSDELRLGEWVLAIGNPFNLTSTVTAGIISAKARNIQILQENYAIESFIQTDAAVNPGNSGGALVNLKGELVGINTAIASRTGSFSGYSFAIPTSIAKKVVTDIIEFGEVQRAVLGVYIDELTPENASKYGVKEIKGVLINGVIDGGAAQQAGIKEGDVVLEINSIPVNSRSQFQEQISKYRPNQQVDLIVNRSNNKKHFTATLRNMKGGLGVVNSDESLSKLGAKFKEVTDKQKAYLGISYGIQVTELSNGKFKEQGIKEGFIILRVNRTPIKTVDDLKRVIDFASGGVLFEGVYPNGVVAYYAIGI